MTVTCDICQRVVDDSLCQVLEEGREILYVCPECFAQQQEQGPESQP